MANVLSLAVKITGDASGLQKSLTPAERAFQTLSQQADRATAAFAPFAAASEAAARAQQQAATDFAFLASALKTGQISAQEYAAAFAQLQAETKATTDAFKAGTQTTAQFATDTEKLAGTLEPLAEQLRLGAIEAPTFQRAIEAAAGVDLSASERGAELLGQLREQAAAGSLDFEQAAESLRQFADEEERSAELAAQAARIQERNRDASADRADEIARLDELLARGLIVQREYDAELAKATGLNDQIAEAERERAQQSQRAAQIIQQNLTAEERAQQNFANSVSEFEQLRRAGLLTEEQYAKAVERVSREYAKATIAASDYGDAAKEAVNESLKFNELSGIFAAIPGPLGNVAGRLSGLSSAAEGLNRVFAGGLTAGIGNVATSFANLVNPTTAALAGVAAFGAGAAGLARGLVDLEGRVENLGRLADQLGVSFEFVQVLEEAGNRADVSVEALSGSFARLQRTLADGGEESKKASQALQVLGVSVQEFGALSEQQQIELIGQRIATIEDPAKRSAAAIELFGRAGVQLIPFFNEIGGAASDLERFSAALSEEDRQRFASLGGSFDALGVSLRALSQNAMLPFIEVVQSVTFTLADLIGTVAQVVDAVGDALSPILTQVGVLFRGFGAIVSAVGDAVIAVFRTLATVIEPIGEFILPAVVAQMTFLNRQIIAGAISGLARTFTAAASTAIAYATSAGTASAATLALGAAVRTLLASTGIGALVVGFGLAANALISWFTAADDAAESNGKVADSAASAADEQARLAEELAREETAMADAAARAIDNVRGKLSAAVDESLKFGQAGFDAAVQYQTAIDDLQEQFDRGILNETSFRREAEKADAAFKAQIDTIKAAVAETEAITRRVDGLLAKANELPQVQQDINAIESEIARVEAAVVAARASGQTEQADALVARLAQLDQLQAGLEQQADEAAQGFAQGFDAAFANVDSGINSLIDKASEFGNAGAVAASQLQEGIAAAQDQVRDGILTKTAFDNEVARQKELFEQRVAGLRDSERIGQQIADQQRAIEDRQFELALEREAELRSVRSGPIEVGDIRTAAGAATFLNLASGAEDPAVAESRKQTRELQAMNRKLDELATQKAEILAGVG